MKKIKAKFIMSEITEHISSKLNSVGLMFRIFSREKTVTSLQRKLTADPEYGKTKKLQDLIGLRVVLYFNDDIDTVRKMISGEYPESSSDASIDEVNKDEFKALRYNIIYQLNDEQILELNLREFSDKIDTTFELQIRTIFSEGWHEVEHDLRYKCKSDWDGFDLESRRLNGVYASLETNEWTMIKVFDELAYSHYKEKKWSAMLRQKFRLRFSDSEIKDSSIITLFNSGELAKSFYRLNRSETILQMYDGQFNYPLTINNFIFFINLLTIKDQQLIDITPQSMISEAELN